MSGSKEDVAPDNSGNLNKLDDSDNAQDEGGDVLILRGSDDDDNERDDEEEDEVESVSQRSTIQEVLLFAFTFCSAKFDYVKDQILYGLTQAKDKVKKLKISDFTRIGKKVI